MSRSYSPWTAQEDNKKKLLQAWQQGYDAAVENDCAHTCGSCEPCERPEPNNPYSEDAK